MRIFFEKAGTDYNDEKVFVTLSKDLGSFPPTYICTCGKDPLRDDGKVLEMMLKDEVSVLVFSWWYGTARRAFMLMRRAGCQDEERFL
jgi:versiconal hemiacetal acetate esterase